MKHSQLEPNASGWVIELWWRRPRHAGQEKPIYWHGPSAPCTATGLNRSVAVFATESQARSTFTTSGAAPPEIASSWNPVTLQTARTRVPQVMATVSWGGGNLASQTELPEEWYPGSVVQPRSIPTLSRWSGALTCRVQTLRLGVLRCVERGGVSRSDDSSLES